MSQEIIDKVNEYYNAAIDYWAESKAEDMRGPGDEFINNYVNACVTLENQNQWTMVKGKEFNWNKPPVLTKPFNSPELYAEAQAKSPSEDKIRQTLLSLVEQIKERISPDSLVQQINSVRGNLEAYLSAQDLMPDEAKQINQAFRDLTQCYFQPPEQHRKDEDHLRMISFFLDDWEHVLNKD